MQPLANVSLDPDCPINWDWEGSTGLTVELTAAPVDGWRGVPKIRDLTRGRGNKGIPLDGTLVSGPLWSGAAGRPGSYGSLNVSGGARIAPLSGLDYLSVPFSVFGWVYQRAQTGYRTVWANSVPRGFYLTGGTPNYYQGGDHLASAAIAANVWAHVGFAYDGTTMTFYVNGAPAGAVVFAAHFSDVSGGIGADAAANNSDGFLDGTMLFSSYLAAAQVAALLDQSRRGNPDHWRWLSRTAWFLPAAPATAATHFLGTLGVGA